LGPGGEATQLERGPTNLLHVRLQVGAQGHATTAPPAAAPPWRHHPAPDPHGRGGPDETFLALLDSGAEANAAGDHWERRTRVSPGGPGRTRTVVGGSPAPATAP
jgi:hypothetical protein